MGEPLGREMDPFKVNYGRSSVFSKGVGRRATPQDSMLYPLSICTL